MTDFKQEIESIKSRVAEIEAQIEAEKADEFEQWDGKKHFADFCKGKIAVNCSTQRDAIIFLNIIHNIGGMWFVGNLLTQNTYWDKYKEKTCYINNNCTGVDYAISYWDTKHYTDKGKHIVQFKGE